MCLSTSHKLVEIAPDSCIFETEDGTRKTAPCDAVILAMGMCPNQDVAQQFAAFPNCRTIGTCVQYGNIAYAVESGFLAASQLQKSPHSSCEGILLRSSVTI